MIICGFYKMRLMFISEFRILTLVHPYSMSVQFIKTPVVGDTHCILGSQKPSDVLTLWTELTCYMDILVVIF